MTTWTQLIDATLNELGDPEGVFHTEDAVQRYLEHGELLMSVSRVLVEKTATITLTSAQADYTIHTLLPDFIYPLRISSNNVPLYQSSLASWGRMQPNWLAVPTASVSTIESYAMIGTTILAFNPPPVSGTAVNVTATITYMACPPTTWSTATIGTSPTIADQWHDDLQDYAKAIALAKESQIPQAQASLKQFVGKLGLPRDTRFLRGSATRDGNETNVSDKQEFKD